MSLATSHQQPRCRQITSDHSIPMPCLLRWLHSQITRFDPGNPCFRIFFRTATSVVNCVRRSPRRRWEGNINLLTPNDDYSGRTAPLTSKRSILYIYSTNIGTEYFKHVICSSFFPLQNAVCFINLTYLVPVLFTFYILYAKI